jgi:thiamine biosynthesis protein ThiS
LVKINGKDVDAAGVSVEKYLKDEGYRVDVIVVEYNEEIIEKEDYSTCILQDGDVVEIVRFMGGGSL